jgi:predicted DNA-binding transcriptional regulator AlpA
VSSNLTEGTRNHSSEYLRSIGQGPKSGKLGRRLVYRRSDVEAWIASAFDDAV